MQRKQSIELWVLDGQMAECLTLIESNGKHRLLRARYAPCEQGMYSILAGADLSSCSVIEFLDVLSSSIAQARRERNQYQICWPGTQAKHPVA